MKDIIEKAREYALSEIKLFGTPKPEHFDLSNEVGQRVARELGADEEIVLLGTILMDLKLGECFVEGKLSEHIKRSSEASRKFLEQFKLDEETVEKIINCVECHHGGKYICLEAEICANADCYRFLHPRGILSAFILWGSRDQDVDMIVGEILKKIEEKHNVLSLDICKKELEPSYIIIKDFIKRAETEKG